MTAIMTGTRFDHNFIHAIGSLPYAPGTLLKVTGAYTVHIVDYRNKLRTFTSGDQFLGMGFAWADIVEVTKDIMNLYGVEGTNPDGTTNGSWGTAISDSDPLVLSASDSGAAATASMSANLKKYAPYIIVGLIVVGALVYKYKKSKK